MGKKFEKMIIRNAEIDYTNFAGIANNCNAAGSRNFCVIFDDLKLVKKMQEDHWNMKPYKPSLNEDTGEYTKYYTQVNVAYDHWKFPDPKIRFVSEGGRKQTNIADESLLNQDSEICPDKLYFDRVDLSVYLNRSTNKVTGKPQTKGYLCSFYAWLEEDELDKEYDNLLYGDEGVPVDEDEVPFDED